MLSSQCVTPVLETKHFRTQPFAIQRMTLPIIQDDG